MPELVPATLKCWLIMIEQRQVTNQVCGVVPMRDSTKPSEVRQGQTSSEATVHLILDSAPDL